MSKFVPVGDCTGLPGTFIHFIKHNAQAVSYRWFSQVADLSAYRGWRLSVDWHVAFYKSHTPSGMPVVFFAHSGIEHVFLRPEDASRFDSEYENRLAIDKGY